MAIEYGCGCGYRVWLWLWPVATWLGLGLGLGPPWLWLWLWLLWLGLWPLWLWLWPTYAIPTRQAACQFVGLMPTSPYISPISPLYLPYISPDISQARGVPVRRPHACPPAEWTAAAGAW
jgi:hypothetical protein